MIALSKNIKKTLNSISLQIDRHLFHLLWIDTSAKRSIYDNTFTTLLLSNAIHQNVVTFFEIKASIKQWL